MLAATPVAYGQTAPMSGTGTVHIENDMERSIFGALRCMCGQCARDLLSTCTCETAAEAREKIRAELNAGASRDRILAEYEAQYGPESLAVPPNHGILRAIWAVPVVGIAVGAAALARMLRRWRAQPDPLPAAGPVGRAKTDGSAPRDAYDVWLDEELKNLDD
jgi:cytochrome c-type biogenesis protein CcmH/NrfF